MLELLAEGGRGDLVLFVLARFYETLRFTKQFGPGEFNGKLFKTTEVDRFDSLVRKNPTHDSWVVRLDYLPVCRNALQRQLVQCGLAVEQLLGWRRAVYLALDPEGEPAAAEESVL